MIYKSSKPGIKKWPCVARCWNSGRGGMPELIPATTHPQARSPCLLVEMSPTGQWGLAIWHSCLVVLVFLSIHILNIRIAYFPVFRIICICPDKQNPTCLQREREPLCCKRITFFFFWVPFDKIIIYSILFSNALKSFLQPLLVDLLHWWMRALLPYPYINSTTQNMRILFVNHQHWELDKQF